MSQDEGKTKDTFYPQMHLKIRGMKFWHTLSFDPSLYKAIDNFKAIKVELGAHIAQIKEKS